MMLIHIKVDLSQDLSEFSRASGIVVIMPSTLPLPGDSHIPRTAVHFLICSKVIRGRYCVIGSELSMVRAPSPWRNITALMPR